MPGSNPTIATTPMASELAQFLDFLADQGCAPVAFHRLAPDHPVPTDSLESLAHHAAQELAGPAPALDIPAADWAARILYQLCQMLALRDFDTARLAEILGHPCPAPHRAETDWSIDLTFRHLPQLSSLALAAPSPDSFLEALHNLAADWPLSSVGMPSPLPTPVDASPAAQPLQEPPRWLRRLAAETTLLETEQPEPGRLCHRRSSCSHPSADGAAPSLAEPEEPSRHSGILEGAPRTPDPRLDSFLPHPALRRLYVDRIVATRDATRLTDARVADTLRADLGLYPELAPSLSSRLHLA